VLAGLDSLDIETVEILTGDAAKTLYGERHEVPIMIRRARPNAKRPPQKPESPSSEE
jgi:hypothetical protein